MKFDAHFFYIFFIFAEKISKYERVLVSSTDDLIAFQARVSLFTFIIIGRPVRATPNHKMEAASSVQQKDKMADGTPRRLCLSHSSTMGPISAERVRVISGHLADLKVDL